MRTVGQILKEERERKLYTLDEIEKATKIRKELLEALEADNYKRLPPPTFVQGFIKNYGKFLGLDTERLLAIFRREFSDRKNPPKIMEAWKSPLQTKRFRLTPAKFISGLVIALVLIFFAYLWYEYRFLVGAPFLEVSAPGDQSSVQNGIVRVIGKTEPEIKVDINNQEVQPDQNGNFSQELKISESVTKITVTATSKAGKTAKIERTVFIKQ
jgi:cytoskeletal protein RodZ